MADGFQIRNVMQGLAGLWAAEHTEGDDEGVTQVETLVKGLKRFKQHEDEEHARMARNPSLREAAYQVADGRAVYYDDGPQTLRDAADLGAVLDENHSTGSPNLENLQARNLLDRLQTGQGLSEHHIGTLRGLLSKHAAKIDAFRKRGRDGQDSLAQASAGSDSRIINPGE
jgi:hypothetical protein